MMKHIGVITYTDGTTQEYGHDGITRGIKCPNFRYCGETSLSLGWMINFQNDDDEPIKTLTCFQCDTNIGTFRRLMTRGVTSAEAEKND